MRTPVSTVFEDTPNFDAFGRLRVSEITSQIDLKQIEDALPLFIDQVVAGTATSTHSINTASTLLETVADEDYAVLQTKQRFAYQTGKSQQIFMTFSRFHPQDNVTKRIGYFSSGAVAPYTADLDGLFLESSDGVVSVNVYRTGVLTSSTPQSQWNVDRLNGWGPSGVTVDWSKSQILLIDFEWLGVGRVRWSFVTDGLIYPFHYSNHANTLQQVYMSNPNQPLRWELRQDGAGEGQFETICATVGSEGAINQLGKLFSVNDDGVSLAIGNTTTRYAGIGIRLHTDALSSMVEFIANNLHQNTTNSVVMWEIILNPAVAGTFTYTPLTNSVVEYAIGDGTNIVTGGTVLDSGFVTARSADRFELKNALKIGATIAGVADTLVLSLKSVSGNCTVFRSITWREQI